MKDNELKTAPAVAHSLIMFWKIEIIIMKTSPFSWFWYMSLAFTWFLFKEPWFSKSDGFTSLSSFSNFSISHVPNPSASPYSIFPSLFVDTYVQLCSIVQMFLEDRIWCWYTFLSRCPAYSLRPTLTMKHAVLPWLAVRQVSRIYLSLTPSYVLPHWPFMWV